MGENYLSNHYRRTQYKGFKYVAYILNNFDLTKEANLSRIYERVAIEFNITQGSVRKSVETYVKQVSRKTTKNFIYDCYYDMNK